MTLRDEVDKLIGDHTKSTPIGLHMLTEGAQDITASQAEAAEDVITLKAAILATVTVLESRLKALG